MKAPLTFVVLFLAPFCLPIAIEQGIAQEIPKQTMSAPLDHSPDRTATHLQVRDGFTVRLAVAEPDVIDPVSAAWGIDGKLWVVEMPDYPHPRPDQTELHGRIRVLSDRDASGRFQQATTFASGLDFATGILPWRDGAIVTLAGQIVFLQDTDGDGKSDSQQVWFSGFTIDNEQLRANHPTLGPDGLVYVAGGLRGGQITAASDRFNARTKPISLQNRDFYFDPHGGDWGTVSGKSQHGLTIDDFNRRIGCSNRNPAIESTIAADVIDRDPYLTATDGIADVGRSGFESHVVPISNAWTTSNLHAGQFSAACGVSAPGWNASKDSEWLLVCEPTGSLVQRQSLRLDGGSWHSEREHQPSEWLACADDWFRPVDLVPDFSSAVLVVDMSRAVIEHPHWAPPELKNRPDTWDGNDQGRIWQVYANDAVPQTHPVDDDDAALAAITSTDPLLRLLASAYWYSNYTPDSLPADSVMESLTMQLDQTQLPSGGRARIAWLLNRWDRLSETQRTRLTSDDDPRLRSLAVGLRMDNRPDGAPRFQVRQLTTALSDPAVLVRQSALQGIALSVDQSILDDALVQALLTVARRDKDHPLVRKLLMSIPGSCAGDLLMAGLTGSPGMPWEVMEGWMLRAAAEYPDRSGARLADWIEQADLDGQANDAALAMQLVTAWRKGAGTKNHSEPWDAQRMRAALNRFSVIDQVALLIATDDHYATPTRMNALDWCRALDPLPAGLRALVEPDSPPALRAAAYRMLLQQDTQWAQQYVLEQANATTPSDRAAIVSAVKQQLPLAVWLLTKIDKNELPRTFVDPAAMDWFRNHSDSKLAALGKQTFAPPGDVADALQKYTPALQQIETADVVRGKALFAQHCASCHRIESVGQVVGPDISDSRTKTPESLLAAILDPSAAIDASFVTYIVLTIDGETITGLLAGESSDAITLQLPGGETRRIERDEIEIFRPSDISLMPSGLQRVMDVSQMRDLIGYLKRWRYATTP
ncbi:c-type cytochrome [Stieleria sp. TO1_6]|uniref:PVC-type heme-binding CxxCH protein n=1 Tax=Stieleria tagensis TaxID=2956795 RepID=UPI00209ACEFE|nr:PVC-type heme-binding CxxCH protein [Stieleria tagensis]MCO8125101.1 c-type cytochrome [Stieleria tagensis]